MHIPPGYFLAFLSKAKQIAGLGLSRSLSCSFSGRWQKNGNCLNPVGCSICADEVTDYERLRESFNPPFMTSLRKLSGFELEISYYENTMASVIRVVFS